PPAATTHTITQQLTAARTQAEVLQVAFSSDPPLRSFYTLSLHDALPIFVVTDKNGKANCTYTGAVAGTETITAFADTNKDFSLDNGEPSDTATKTWRSAPATSLTLSPKRSENHTSKLQSRRQHVCNHIRQNK